MNASEIAYKAAEYMAEHGHCKGLMKNFQGRVCLMGAVREIGRSGESGPWTVEEFIVLDKAKKLGYSIQNENKEYEVAAWNDAPERTGEDVILALKHIGAELEAEGK